MAPNTDEAIDRNELLTRLKVFLQESDGLAAAAGVLLCHLHILEEESVGSQKPSAEDNTARQPQRPAAETIDACMAVAHDIAEAVTAITNYVEAACRLLEAETEPCRTTLVEILAKSLAQTQRASAALRRIRAILGENAASR